MANVSLEKSNRMHTPLSRSEVACIAFLWVLSPLPALCIWAFLKLVLFYQESIHDDIHGRYECAAPLSAWLAEWWHQGWWIFLVGLVGVLIVAPLYSWAALATWRLFASKHGKTDAS